MSATRDTISHPAPPWSVVVVDDHDVVRWALCELFGRDPDFEVVGSAGEAHEALALVRALGPDIVITDLSLPGRGGIDLVANVRSFHPEARVVVLSMHDASLYADRVRAAGAHAYLEKSMPHEEVTRLARALMTEGVGAGVDSLGAPGADARRAAERPRRAEDLLTDRELEVLRLIGLGYQPRDIALKLSLSTSTVEVHRQHLKSKLGLKDATHLRRYAVARRSR